MLHRSPLPVNDVESQRLADPPATERSAQRSVASLAEPRNQVVQVNRFGNADGLEVVGAAIPTAGRGEVRVRVLASSLHYTDVLIRRHLYPQTARHRPPFVMGYDVVGEIDQVGEGVRDFKVGDRVADMTVIGSNATYRTLRAKDLTRVPPDVDAAEAATLILSWMTAYQLLHRAARVQAGQRVLVHGAAGAVGQALLVLGKRAGLELWGAARGEHAALVRELGGTPIDYKREDFTRVVPGGFDVVFDGIGEEGYRRSLAALKPGGLLLAIGFSAGVQAKQGMRTILMSIARIYLWRFLPGGKRARFYSINVMRARHPSWFREDLERLFGLLATHAIQPRVAKRIAFDEVADAHRRLEAGGLEGKLVLCPAHMRA
jgi:NADPH:quinone reductase